MGTTPRKTEGRSQILEPVHRITEDVTATNTHKIQVCRVGDWNTRRGAVEVDMIFQNGEPLLVKSQRT